MSVEGSDPQSREGKKSQKVSDSHRNDVSPLTQGLRYRAACDKNQGKFAQDSARLLYSKAFDSVCHNKLLLKLTAYGICGSLLNWISSFLSHCFCQTRIGNCLSSALPILSGVVQGSCLGPVLFILFVNDISDLFSDDTCVKLFADDVKL